MLRRASRYLPAPVPYPCTPHASHALGLSSSNALTLLMPFPSAAAAQKHNGLQCVADASTHLRDVVDLLMAAKQERGRHNPFPSSKNYIYQGGHHYNHHPQGTQNHAAGNSGGASTGTGSGTSSGSDFSSGSGSAASGCNSFRGGSTQFAVGDHSGGNGGEGGGSGNRYGNGGTGGKVSVKRFVHFLSLSLIGLAESISFSS